MTLRPLPKTVAPLRDELLSGWLARLAASNYCEISELLAHVGLDSRYADTLDFELNAEAAGRIAAAARVSPALVQSLIRYLETSIDVILQMGRQGECRGIMEMYFPGLED